MEKTLIRGVAKDTSVTTISVVGLKDQPGVAFKLFNKLAQYKVNVDIILQSVGRHGTKDITFTVSHEQQEDAIKAMESMKGVFDYQDLKVNNSLSKISIVGAGMESNPGVASKMFEALYDASINIHMISASEIKISVLVDQDMSEKAVKYIHDKFDFK